MPKIHQHACSKMWRDRAVHKIDFAIAEHNAATRRQARIRVCVKIHRQRHPGLRKGGCAQDADAARLDQPGQRGRGAGDKAPAFARKTGSVIRNQPAPHGHHLQRKRGFPPPRGAKDDDRSPFVQRHAACMKGDRPASRWRDDHQTGRPTTNRAPRGSEVASAVVGWMFSAQITPPCASTICLEIARPRPEWFPKSPCGRSE